jgi:N-acetylglucosamine kinase-like BadF-type ATPase
VIFLGIDGGGSKTAFLLENDDGQELARFETGPSNWLSSGSGTARESLASGITRLPSTPDVVCGGFAGAGRAEGVEFYRTCLTALLPKAQVMVETDAFITFIGAIGLIPGLLLIAGTGSIALARKSDGTMIRAGGWGPAFSDEGGGFWIGREAIRHALRANDAGKDADFVATITKGLNLNTITDAPAAWKDGALDVRSIAAVASTVTRQYPAEPARQILSDAAAHLRALSELARQRADLPETCPRSVSGSIGTQPMMLQLIGLPFSPAANPPARGAILWARARIKSS